MRVTRVTVVGFIVVVSGSNDELELCTEEAKTITKSSDLPTSHLLIGDSASVFSSRASARSAITRTKKRAIKERTAFKDVGFRIVRLLGVPS